MAVPEPSKLVGDLRANPDDTIGEVKILRANVHALRRTRAGSLPSSAAQTPILAKIIPLPIATTKTLATSTTTRRTRKSPASMDTSGRLTPMPVMTSAVGCAVLFDRELDRRAFDQGSKVATSDIRVYPKAERLFFPFEPRCRPTPSSSPDAARSKKLPVVLSHVAVLVLDWLSDVRDAADSDDDAAGIFGEGSMLGVVEAPVIALAQARRRRCRVWQGGCASPGANST
jgi:hypothetical protein